MNEEKRASYHSSFRIRHSSFVPKRHNRVYLRRAASGDEAGDERGRRKNQRDDDEGQRVGRGDSVEQARHDARARGGRRGGSGRAPGAAAVRISETTTKVSASVAETP